MERTFRLTGAGMNRNFVDDSPRQAKPVASSTLMVSKTEFDFKDLDASINSPKATSALSACSTTSSLGVLDLEKQSLLSDLELSRDRSRSFVQEQLAISRNRFRERIGLSDSSMNDEKLSIGKFSLPLNEMTPETMSNNQSSTLSANSVNSPHSRRMTSAQSACLVPSSRTSLVESLSSDMKASHDKSRSFVQEQIAQSQNRFKERIGLNGIALETDNDETLSQKKNGLVEGREPETPRNSYSIRTLATTLSNSRGPSMFENLSNTTSPVSERGSFISGKQAMVRLEADQKENRKQFDSLPVSPTNISWNSENIEEQENQFSRIVSAKSYSPKEIPDVLRNRSNLECKSKITLTPNDLKNEAVTFDADQHLPRVDAPPQTDVRRVSTFPVPKTEFNFNDPKLNGDIKIAIADSTSFNDTFEDSRASSVASIHQITEALKRKSFISEPRRAIEHLLSVGTKPKYVPSLASVMDVRSDEDTLNASQITEHNRTPTSSPFHVETPGTSTASTSNLKVNAVTKKVYASTEKFNPSFMTARQLLESKCFARTVHVDTPEYFQLCRGSSPLDNSVQRNDMRGFWKINAINSDHLPNVGRKATSQLLGDYLRKVDELSRESLSKSNIMNYSKGNVSTQPVRRISMNHNVSNVTDSVYPEGVDADALDAGVLCVGTQVEVIIAIENPSHMAVKYKIFVKSMLVNKKVNFCAATVMLVSEQSDITLSPKTENEIKILLTPLVEGKIEVFLEFVCEQSHFTNITHLITATGELPKLKILRPEELAFYFDKLGEKDSKVLPFRLLNEGSARLPLKLVIYEDDRSKMSCWRAIVEPADVFHCDLRVTSPALDDSSGQKRLQGELEVVLDTSEEGALMHIVQLQRLQLEAVVVKRSLLIDCKMPQVIFCSPTSNHGYCHIRVKNTSSMVTNITTRISDAFESDFKIDPKTFELSPHEEQQIKVAFSPTTKERRKEVDILFYVDGLSGPYSCRVIGIFEPDEMAASLSTPSLRKHVSAACNSPTSSQSSIGADGPMELDCTHNSISWGSVPLHSKSIQTITLRNRNSQKEKLILSISDSNGAFKFVENELFSRELKLALEPKESRKISILFMPFVADQALNSRILIMRQHSLESSLTEFRKLVIPLYGIGGRVKITYSGVFRDNENRLWITPDLDTFDVKFSVENSGDSVAFVKIISEDPDDGVLPDELILLPRESSEVCYTLRLCRDRLDLVCKQNPQKEVLLTSRLTVLSGNESTRLRIKKLWTKYTEFDNIQRIRDKVEVLVDMGIRGPLVVNTLGDNQSTLNKLWYEGVTEESIGVLISQEHLESVSLDSTVVFKDLKDESTSS